MLLPWCLQASAEPEGTQAKTDVQTDTQIEITAPLLDDVSLSKVYGRGVEDAKISPNDQIGVILWDEADQGAKRVRMTNPVTTGQRNVQRTSVVRRKYQ